MWQAVHICILGFSSSVRLTELLDCRWTAIFRFLRGCLIGFKALAGPLKLFISCSCIVLAVCLGSLSCLKVNLMPSSRFWVFFPALYCLDGSVQPGFHSSIGAKVHQTRESCLSLLAASSSFFFLFCKFQLVFHVWKPTLLLLTGVSLFKLSIQLNLPQVKLKCRNIPKMIQQNWNSSELNFKRLREG